MEYFLFSSIIIIAIIQAVIWFSIISILTAKGYKVNYWWRHIKVLSDFSSVIGKEDSSKLKIKYSLLLTVFILLFILFIINVVMITQFEGI